MHVMTANEAMHARPAATVVIFREGRSSVPELLIVERSGSMAFAAGALVFPGGAVDPDDVVLASSLGWTMPADEGAARIAAIREAIEESGMAVGFDRTPAPDQVSALRHGLHAGEAFSVLLARTGLTIDPHALVPFARWHPNAGEKVRRVFDTRFYLARDMGGVEATVDARENVRLFWASAAEVLDRCARGEGRIIFPTQRNLERLAQFDSFEAASRHALATPIEKVTPWVEERADGPHLCIPSHLGYPVTSEPIGTAMRG